MLSDRVRSTGSVSPGHDLGNGPVGLLKCNQFLRRHLKSSKVALNVCHLNVRGLISSIDTLRLLLENYDVQFFGVTETWLLKNTVVHSKAIELPGFKFVRHDRQVEKSHGGVGLYVKKGINAKIIRRSDASTKVEFLFVEVCDGSMKLLIGVVYKPLPCASYDDLDPVLADLVSCYDNIVIMGDFNINILSDSSISNTFRCMWESLSLSIVPSGATHFGNFEPTALDLFVANNLSKVLYRSQFSVPGISDHDFIFMSFDVGLRNNSPVSFTFKDFSQINLDDLLFSASNLPWDQVYRLNDVDHKLQMINQLLLHLFNEAVPIKTVRIKYPNTPWLTRIVEEAFLLRDIAYATYKRNITPANHEKFRSLRNRANHLVRQSKLNFSERFLDSKLDSGTLWKRLKSSGLA